MAEYITKKQVIEWFRPYGHTDEGIPFSTLKTDVMGMPAADVAPVRIGRWIEEKQTLTCSTCRYIFRRLYPRSFCPNCGAIMDGWRCSLRGIDKDPTVNVEPVVRCANCKYLMSHLTDGPVCGHSYGLRVIFRDSFCPYGEYQANGGAK